MKKIILLILATTIVANAERSVSVLDIDGKVVSFPAVAVTGGETLKLRVALTDALLDKTAITLHQRGSGGLVMPIPADITVTPEDSKVIYNVNVIVPEVKNIASVFLLFDLNKISTASKQPPITPPKVERLPVTIFPPEDIEATGRALNQKIEQGKWRLTVVNKRENDRLGDFLIKRKVDFTTSDSLAADTLTLVDASAKEFKNMLPVADGTRVIAFVETSDSFMPPCIQTTQAANGTVVTTVTLPILGDLETNPRSREILLNLLNQHLSRDPINE